MRKIEPTTATIGGRVTEAERRAFERAAAQRGVSLASLVRLALHEYCEGSPEPYVRGHRPDDRRSAWIERVK